MEVDFDLLLLLCVEMAMRESTESSHKHKVERKQLERAVTTNLLKALKPNHPYPIYELGTENNNPPKFEKSTGKCL